MPFGSSIECTCKECGERFVHVKKLSEHIKKMHGLASIDYYVKHECAGARPVCPTCGGETRFVSLGAGFKKYCPGDRSVAECEAGRVGGSSKKENVVTMIEEVEVPVSFESVSPCRPSRCIDELVSFVRSVCTDDVKVNDPAAPGSATVWIPSSNLAIDIHGIDWLDENDSLIAFEKRGCWCRYEACRSRGVRLMQFFTDEWMNKGNICRSMIQNALGKDVLKVHARECDVVVLDSNESRKFCNDNHVSGGTRSSRHFGLRHPQHGLVGVVTTRTPIQKKHGHVCELARMCFLQGASVRGGASKLLARVTESARADGFDGLLSYAELRYGQGGVYEKCGFTLVGEALGMYWYSSRDVRHNRFKYRAQPGKPERQVAIENNVRGVWGVGNKIYLKKL